jgi:hypothetical protein
MKQTIEHITLNSGHTRHSPRSEVSDEIIAALQDGITAALSGRRVAVPNCPGYTMTAGANGGCLMATIWGGESPLVTVGVAADHADSAKLWNMLHEDQPGLKTSSQKGALWALLH